VRPSRFGHREPASSLARSGTEIGRKKNLAGFHAERSNVKSAILPDSTVSGGFWEERNAKVTKTIKIHVEWTVLDCGHLEIPNKGEKTSLFLS
jgi:hypothetical protein